MISEKEIINITETIINKFNPIKIYLFGSYAAGSAHETSDLDLLVIDNTKQKNRLALEISSELFPRYYSLDLIVATPDEIHDKKKRGMSFWINITEKGRLLYERH